MGKKGSGAKKRLTTDQEKAVVKEYRTGTTSYRELAKKYHVTQQVVFRAVKRAGSNKSAIRKIEEESVRKAREIAIEFQAKHIAEETAKLLKTGEILATTLLGEINAEVKKLQAGTGSASDFRALVSAYRDLVPTLRLQRGQATQVTEDTGSSVVIESIEERVVRMQETGEIEDLFGENPPAMPGEGVTAFQRAKRRVVRRKEKR